MHLPKDDTGFLQVHADASDGLEGGVFDQFVLVIVVALRTSFDLCSMFFGQISENLG